MLPTVFASYSEPSLGVGCGAPWSDAVRSFPYLCAALPCLKMLHSSTCTGCRLYLAGVPSSFSNKPWRLQKHSHARILESCLSCWCFPRALQVRVETPSPEDLPVSLQTPFRHLFTTLGGKQIGNMVRDKEEIRFCYS